MAASPHVMIAAARRNDRGPGMPRAARISVPVRLPAARAVSAAPSCAGPPAKDWWTKVEAVKGLLTTKFGNSPGIGAGTVFYAGSVARMAAELDLGCGDYAAAVTNFEEGLRIDATLGARPYLALGRMGVGTCPQRHR